LTRPSRIFTAIALILGVVLLLGILAVMIDERCSRHEDAWANRTQAIEQLQDLPSVRPSKGE
jgi:hypothetical protein